MWRDSPPHSARYQIGYNERHIIPSEPHLRRRLEKGARIVRERNCRPGSFAGSGLKPIRYGTREVPVARRFRQGQLELTKAALFVVLLCFQYPLLSRISAKAQARGL